MRTLWSIGDIVTAAALEDRELIGPEELVHLVLYAENEDGQVDEVALPLGRRSARALADALLAWANVSRAEPTR